MLPKEEGCETSWMKGREEANADTEPVGVVEKSAGLTNQSLLEIHVCKGLREFTTRASPGFFQMHFTIELMVDLFQMTFI